MNEEEDDEAPRSTTKKAAIAPDWSSSSASDDDGGGGPGFDHILTGRAIDSKRKDATMAKAKKLPVQPLLVTANAGNRSESASQHEKETKKLIDGVGNEEVRPAEDNDLSTCVSVKSIVDGDSISSVEGAGEIEDSDAPDLSSDQRCIQLEQLRDEIRTRQRRLAKLLQGKEGSAYARMMQNQEDAANAYLLLQVGAEGPRGAQGIEEVAAEETSSTGDTPLGALQSMLMDEWHHSLPGAFSLVVHCILYITFTKGSESFLDKISHVLLRAIGWDPESENRGPDNVFKLISLGLALLACRATGVLYDWNQERGYQRRVTFHLRNKWFLKFQDARLLDFFHGGELREKYEPDEVGVCNREEEGNEPDRSRRWGPRLKHVLDIISYFIACACIISLVESWGSIPVSNITEEVMAGVPSRQMREQSHDGGTHHSCASVMTALDKPYGSGMMEWLASVDAEGAHRLVANAKECGWQGTSSGIKETLGGDDQGARSDSCDANNDENDACDDDADENDSPTLVLWKKSFLSLQDEQYLKEMISPNQFHVIVGDPSPMFYDRKREAWFYVVITMFGFGVLWLCDIPWCFI
ncbi:hypothetical protein ACHAWF_018022 [Thalassiosira exigua]